MKDKLWGTFRGKDRGVNDCCSWFGSEVIGLEVNRGLMGVLSFIFGKFSQNFVLNCSRLQVDSLGVVVLIAGKEYCVLV